MAVTDGVQSENLQFTNPGGLNRLGYWGALGYKGEIAGVKYDAGINTGLSQDANSVNISQTTPVSTVNQANTEWGYNPYVKLAYGNFELAAEFEQVTVDHGRGATPATATRAAPYGFQITPSYKITPEWELAARYAYLSTNGRGVQIKDVVRDGENALPTVGTTAPLFNNVSSYYVGVNWYIEGPSVKLSLGYELDQFTDRSATGAGGSFTGPRANVEGVRSQLQVLF